jgi:hypothetical protein
MRAHTGHASSGARGSGRRRGRSRAARPGGA